MERKWIKLKIARVLKNGLVLALVLMQALPSGASQADVRQFPDTNGNQSFLLRRLADEAKNHFTQNERHFTKFAICLEQANCHEQEHGGDTNQVMITLQGLRVTYRRLMIQALKHQVALGHTRSLSLGPGYPVIELTSDEIGQMLAIEAEDEAMIEQVCEQKYNDNIAMERCRHYYSGVASEYYRNSLFTLLTQYPFLTEIASIQPERSNFARAFYGIAHLSRQKRNEIEQYFDVNDRAWRSRLLVKYQAIVEKTLNMNPHLVEVYEGAIVDLENSQTLFERLSGYLEHALLACSLVTAVIVPVSMLSAVCGVAGLAMFGNGLYGQVIEYSETRENWLAQVIDHRALASESAELAHMVILSVLIGRGFVSSVHSALMGETMHTFSNMATVIRERLGAFRTTIVPDAERWGRGYVNFQVQNGAIEQLAGPYRVPQTIESIGQRAQELELTFSHPETNETVLLSVGVGQAPIFAQVLYVIAGFDLVGT